MITVTVSTGDQYRSLSFATKDEALDYMTWTDSDVVVYDDGIPVAFRFYPADEAHASSEPDDLGAVPAHTDSHMDAHAALV